MKLPLIVLQFKFHTSNRHMMILISQSLTFEDQKIQGLSALAIIQLLEHGQS
jgi:hypothetical protein